MELFDTHCHVHFNAFKADSDEVIARTRAAGVLMNLVGTQRDTSVGAVAVAERSAGVYASVGLHPVHLFSQHIDEEESSFATREEHFDRDFYEQLARHEKVIAIGECGYDLYRLPPEKTIDEVLARQRDVFAGHVAVARAVSKPLVVHVRDAYKEMIATLREEQKQVQKLRGTIHCYISDWENAREFLELGFYLGFTGIITFPPKKSDPTAHVKLLEAVKNCPLERMLLETDAPYLAPGAYRGKRSEPWMVKAVAEKIAEVKGITFEEVAEVTTRNARELFGVS